MKLTTTKQSDYLNRLTAIASQPAASGLLPLVFNYNYNAAKPATADLIGMNWLVVVGPPQYRLSFGTSGNGSGSGNLYFFYGVINLADA